MAGRIQLPIDHIEGRLEDLGRTEKRRALTENECAELDNLARRVYMRRYHIEQQIRAAEAKLERLRARRARLTQ